MRINTLACEHCGKPKTQSCCKQTRNAYMREWNAKNPDKVRAINQKRYAANPEYFKTRAAEFQQSEHGMALRRNRYGERRDELTTKRRERYALDEEHREHVRGGRNAWHAENREWANFRMVLNKYRLTLDQYHAMQESQDFCCAICGEELPLCVDHCHETEQVRGLLCAGCNLGLGAFRDSPAALLQAAAYLQ